MRICPRQSGAKLTFFSGLSPTGGAANRQRLFLAHFHSHIVRRLLDSKLVTSDQYIARHSPTILHCVPSLSPLPLENTGLSIVPPIRKGKLQVAIFNVAPDSRATVFVKKRSLVVISANLLDVLAMSAQG